MSFYRPFKKYTLNYNITLMALLIKKQIFAFPKLS